MGVLKAVLIFAVIQSAFAQEGGLLKPCKINDMECLSETTQNFLEQSSAGIPDYDLKAIDPLVIPELNVEVPEFDLVFHFKNVTVTGLKNQKISDFKLDKATKSVKLQTRVDDARVVADVTIELKPGKKLSGVYYAKTTTIGTTRYNYNLIPNKEGVEYFEVGPETITCEVVGTPEVTLDSELTNTLANDPDARAKKEGYEKKSQEIRSHVMSEIFSKAYITVIHNIRAVAKVYPKSAFFKDI